VTLFQFSRREMHLVSEKPWAYCRTFINKLNSYLNYKTLHILQTSVMQAWAKLALWHSFI